MEKLTKSKLLLLPVCLLIVVGGVFAFTHWTNCNSVSAYCPVEKKQNLTVSDISQELALNYWTYSPSAEQFAHQYGEKVVLYFWAPWCSTCSSLDDEIQKNDQQVPSGVIVLRVNYDDSEELKNKYQVTTQHTFVQIDDNSNEITKWVGGEIENFDKYLQ